MLSSFSVRRLHDIWDPLGQFGIHPGPLAHPDIGLLGCWRRKWSGMEFFAGVPQCYDVRNRWAIRQPRLVRQTANRLIRCIASFVLMIGSVRVNVFFVLVFFSLVMLFAFIAAADFRVATATTEADLKHILDLLKFAGGFGFIALICGW
jgi:hypothetical protein